MMIQMLMTAFVVGVAVAMPIGPVSIAAGRRAITLGFFPAFFFNMGSITSDTLYALAVYVGLAPFLADNDWLKLLMWIVGGAWLCWLGWEAIRTQIKSDDLTVGTVAQESRWRSYGSGVGITLTNPLTVVSWIALAGNFFAGWRDSWPAREDAGLLAMLVILLGVFTWAIGLIMVLSMIRRFISPRALHWVSVLAGGILILFGLSAWASAVNLIL